VILVETVMANQKLTPRGTIFRWGVDDEDLLYYQIKKNGKIKGGEPTTDKKVKKVAVALKKGESLRNRRQPRQGGFYFHRHLQDKVLYEDAPGKVVGLGVNRGRRWKFPLNTEKQRV